MTRPLCVRNSDSRKRPGAAVRFFAVLLAAFLVLNMAAVPSARADDDTVEEQEPPQLKDLENIPDMTPIVDGEKTGMPFDIRADALKEAALSYGARGGLARRTFEIRQDLDLRAPYMDKVFDFRHLLIPAPSGLMIEPPIVSEAENAMLIENSGLNAAVSDRYYNISENVRIVSAPRSWHSYLERTWGEVTPPPDILRPKDDKERALWKKLVKQGWDKGYEQADDVFQDDLARLVADYTGMVRYRMLLSQNMISPPYALQVDRGVTGGGKEMRVGDRSVQITGLPELKPGYDQWRPASR